MNKMFKHVSKRMITLFFVGFSMVSLADEHHESDARMHHHHHQQHSAEDMRISLGLSPAMKQHQLANMRAHLAAVQTIVRLIAENDFFLAANVAQSKLGMSEEMKKMCNMFNDAEFTALGMAFHQSGDTLSEALKTKDAAKSLKALDKTLGYCVQCHANYRQ